MLGPGIAYADSVATNGGATSITNTSAVLNGTVNVSNANSGYVFQYGSTTSYGSNTTLQTIKSTGVSAVFAKLMGLSPGTTYHFRLAVAQGSYPTNLSYSADQTFTTTNGGGGHSRKHGHASLRSHRLRVHAGVVSIPFKCSGARGTRCAGRVTLTARGKLGGKVKTVRCASARFRISAGSSFTVRATVSGRCLVLLRKARGHRHGARLRATFSTHQRPLRASVTLVRKRR